MSSAMLGQGLHSSLTHIAPLPKKTGFPIEGGGLNTNFDVGGVLEGEVKGERGRRGERFQWSFRDPLVPFWAEGNWGRKEGIDGWSKIQSWRGPVFDNSSIHHRSARPIPGKQKSPLKKNIIKSPFTLMGCDTSTVRKAPETPRSPPSLSDRAQDPIVLSTTAHPERVGRKKWRA